MDAVIAVVLVVAAIAVAGRALDVWCTFVRAAGILCCQPVRTLSSLMKLQALFGWIGVPRAVCAVAAGLVIVITLFGWGIESIPGWVALVSFCILSLMVFLGGIGEGVVLHRQAAADAAEVVVVSSPQTMPRSDCAACGTRLSDGARFCQECGMAVRISSRFEV